LVLIGALPAAAGQSSSAPAASTPVGLVAGGDMTDDRARSAQKVRDDMLEWQR
jgi:cytolysin (calcineurin-like family phosphatase)